MTDDGTPFLIEGVNLPSGDPAEYTAAAANAARLVRAWNAYGPLVRLARDLAADPAARLASDARVALVAAGV